MRVTAWIDYLKTLNRPFEILLVDDRSEDATFATAESLAAKHVELKLLRTESPTGFGAALRLALKAALHPLFFYTAFDYPYEATEFTKLLEKIDEIDIAVGFRAGRPEPLGYKILNGIWETWLRIAFGIPRHPKNGWLGGKQLMFARLVRIVFGVHVQDVDIAFKLFRREVFARIPIQSDGPFVHAEIIAKANFLSCWMMDEFLISPIVGTDLQAVPIEFRWSDRWKDMWQVLKNPNFGPYPLPVTAILEPESAVPEKPTAAEA